MKLPERVYLYDSYEDEIKDINRLAKKHGMGEIRLSMPIASARAWYNFHKPDGAMSHRWTAIKK